MAKSEYYMLLVDALGQFKKKCKLKIKEHYTEEWKNCLENSSKCYLYKGLSLS